MVPLDRATTSSFSLPIITMMSSCAAVWPQFSVQGFKLLVTVARKQSALLGDSWLFVGFAALANLFLASTFNLTFNFSVGGCSPWCQRCSQSTGIPKQYVHGPACAGHISRPTRQRRRPRREYAHQHLFSYSGWYKPVVGSRLGCSTVRRRRQIDQ